MESLGRQNGIQAAQLSQRYVKANAECLNGNPLGTVRSNHVVAGIIGGVFEHSGFNVLAMVSLLISRHCDGNLSVCPPLDP